MDTLGKRIKKVIIHNGITMTSFAKDLNISQSMVSKMCSDKAMPSDRTISDICRIYNINKEWLQNGVGEMVNKESMRKELSQNFTDDTSDATKKVLLTLAEIPPAVWPILADELKKLADSTITQPNDYVNQLSEYEQGKQAGLRAWKVIQKAIQELPEEPSE